MSWTDRDWAKWTDEERRRFLGSGGGGSGSGRDIFLGGHGGRHTAGRPGDGDLYTDRFLNPDRQRTHRTLIRRSAWPAILVSGALALLGQLPRGHPLLPALHFNLPALHHTGPKLLARGAAYSVSTPPPPASKIKGPHEAPVGSILTLRGQATVLPLDGLVRIEGSYDGGRTWHELAAVGAPDTWYAAHIPLTQRGLLHLRIRFADGSRAVGSVRVR